MPHTYTENELREVFLQALDLFNACIESDISEKNTVLAFFTPNTGKMVYEEFCGAHFPKHLQEPYWKDGYFEGFAAQAFVGDDRYGVLLRSDLRFHPIELLHILLHEISHLYCTCNEIPGGHFFDRYCMGSGAEDGQMNAGYAVWREFVADLMASSVLSETTYSTLTSVRESVTELYDAISGANPESKKCMSLILVSLMNTREVGCTDNWNIAERAIRRAYPFDDLMIYALQLVFDKLQQRPFWNISPEFIMELGGVYLLIVSNRTIAHLRF